jgi:rhodanese-related sulfurtransferase
MRLKQFYLNCLAQASYLIGDEDTHTAAVVDPRRDVHVYLEEAAQCDLQIKYVFLTHFHADFLAGHLDLRDRTGATMNVPLTRLRSQMCEVPRARRTWVCCAGGYRSSIAASLLRHSGFIDIVDLAGGIAAWEAAGLCLVH